MDKYIIMIGLFVIILGAALFLINRHYKRQENNIMKTLQAMINAAVKGEISDIQFDESKLSYLENSMKHYLMSQDLLLTKLHEQKDTIQSMVTDISHQSTSPISNILLYTELLEEQSNGFSDEFHVVKEEVRKLDFLIQSLVKSARLETGIISLNPKKENIGMILQSIKNQYSASAIKKQITFQIESVTLEADFDLKWTTEAVSNIVDNAIKYTSAGGKVAVRVIPYQIFARIDVIDTGIGISENEQNKVFQRFYRSIDVEKVPGVGIGLYLAREIIQMEKGYIKIESQKGAGSRFSVFLPL